MGTFFTSVISRNIFAILLISIVIVGYYSVVKNQKDVHSSQWVIETESVPTLLPHTHEINDTVLDPDHHIIVSSETITVEENVWITSMELAIRNAHPATLHHADLFRLNKINPICHSFPGEEIVSMGVDTMSSFLFPEPYGILLKKGDVLRLDAMFHNPFPPVGPGKVYTNASIALVLGLNQENNTIHKPVEFYRLDLEDASCGGVFTVPPYTRHFIKDGARFIFSRPGTIIGMGGHLHPWEGGETLSVFLNGVLVQSFTSMRTSDEPWSWITPGIKTSIPIQLGDEISITATYSNPESISVIGAMGKLGFYFAADE